MSILQISPHVGWKVLSDTTVVVSLIGGNSYNFSGSSKLIWDLIIEGKPKEDIILCMAEKYTLSHETATADLDAFIKELLLDNLVQA